MEPSAPEFSELIALTGQKSAITCMAISPDGRSLVSGSEDGSLKIWEIEGGKLLQPLESQEHRIASIFFTPDGKYLTTVSHSVISEMRVLVWNFLKRELLHAIAGDRYDITAAVMTPDGTAIITGGSDKNVRIWDLATGKLKQVLSGHHATVSAIAIAPDGNTIVSGSSEWEFGLKIWTNKASTQVLVQPSSPVAEASIITDDSSQQIASPTFVPESMILADEILERLQREYPNATYELDWETPEQMLVATLLAAQCTDERVNRVTKVLFAEYPTPQAIAQADPAVLAEILKPTGFYQQKTQTIQTVCQQLIDRFDGAVPRNIEDLTSIPGIARKSANVVLNCCFNIPSEIIVDTHVARVSQRLSLSTNNKPERIERDLMKIVPESAWTFWGSAMVLHGCYTCKAKDPECDRCIFADFCPLQGIDDDSVEDRDSQPLAIEEPSWQQALASEMQKSYCTEILSFVAKERREHQIFPSDEDVFTAFELTPLSRVKVVVLGQDPYHGAGQAHGLSFSVKPGVAIPPSLVNIFKELNSDLGIAIPKSGDLTQWAHQGVLLLNTVLTVRSGSPNSHKDRGWERFTDAVIKLVSENCDRVIFVLWGRPAQKKAKLIDASKHVILNAAHPSPLSAHNGFFGSRPFSQINKLLEEEGKEAIAWQLD